MKSKLIEAYIQQSLEQNRTPQNVYTFAKAIDSSEQDFYNYYSSLEALEADIYKTWFEQSMEKCVQSEPWTSYSSREKVLAIFFTFIEELKANRSFVQHLKHRDFKPSLQWPAYLKALHESFIVHVSPVLNEGISSNEIAQRKFIDEKYVEGLWLNFLFVIKFWIDDHSPAFEKTDAAIEKSVNLAFDLMGKSPLDSVLDFGKFLFQNR